MRIYKITSLCLAVIFIVVGFLFLFFTNSVLEFFNNLSFIVGLPKAPLDAVNFYLALALSFMYLVTILAFYMYKNPDNKIYPILLIHGKAASSFFSLYLFLTHDHFLIYISNFIIDGSIAIIILLLINAKRRTR